MPRPCASAMDTWTELGPILEGLDELSDLADHGLIEVS